MRRPGQGPAGARGGTTLVEVIIGCLILAVLALAAMASLQYTRSMTVRQRDPHRAGTGQRPARSAARDALQHSPADILKLQCLLPARVRHHVGGFLLRH